MAEVQDDAKHASPYQDLIGLLTVRMPALVVLVEAIPLRHFRHGPCTGHVAKHGWGHEYSATWRNPSFAMRSWKRRRVVVRMPLKPSVISDSPSFAPKQDGSAAVVGGGWVGELASPLQAVAIGSQQEVADHTEKLPKPWPLFLTQALEAVSRSYLERTLALRSDNHNYSRPVAVAEWKLCYCICLSVLQNLDLCSIALGSYRPATWSMSRFVIHLGYVMSDNAGNVISNYEYWRMIANSVFEDR